MKKKILILNYEYPPIGGGAGVVSRYHAEGLAAEGYKVTVLTAWYKGEKEKEDKGNLSVIKLKSKRRHDYKSTPDEWLSWIRLSKKFLTSFLAENPQDYCIAHFALPGGEVARYIHKRFNLPYAIISHGQDIPWISPKQMFKYHLVTYFWIKTICKNATHLILLTKAMKKNADRFMGKYKYKNIIIPNGCATQNFYPNLNTRSKTFKILFVGRLVTVKAPFVFLKALVSLKKRIGSNFTVSILGDGDLKLRMQQFVHKNDLQTEVRFKGWVSKKEMLAEYQSAHVQVMSSEAEAMSIAALESLASGVYLISTPVSGNTDIITENINGELFPHGKSEILAEKLTNYYNNKFKKNDTIPPNFLSRFRAKYDWTNIVKSLIQELNMKRP